MKSGKVKWFDDDKGFGFIKTESGQEAFVHYSEINDDGYKTLEQGEKVKFKTSKTDKGISAISVNPVNGESSSNSSQNEKDDTNKNTANETNLDQTFEELGVNDKLLERIDKSGFKEPRPIQVKSIPHLFDGRDLIGTAPTGTGKTAAFLLPIIQRLSGSEGSNPRALILAPTHELADQIAEEARSLNPDDDLVIASVYGGTDIWDEMTQLEDQVDILIACTGRLLDHIQRKSVDLSEVEICVLDEADRMCDMGFLPDIRSIFRQIPKNRQNLFFSATIPPEIEELAQDMLEDPVSVSVGQQAPAETISHYVCEIEKHNKEKALKHLLDNFDTESVLIFCRTRKTVKKLAKSLRKQGYDASPLQGGMDSIAREATLSGFRRQSFKILIATNVAARGLDVDHISHVINYDVPEDPDVYTHRIGRTGRAGSLGEAYTFSTSSDSGSIQAIESTIDEKIERKELALS